MSPGSLKGGAGSAALAAGLSLVFVLQAGDWTRVSNAARHYFRPTLIVLISTRILYS